MESNKGAREHPMPSHAAGAPLCARMPVEADAQAASETVLRASALPRKTWLARVTFWAAWLFGIEAFLAEPMQNRPRAD